MARPSRSQTAEPFADCSAVVSRVHAAPIYKTSSPFIYFYNFVDILNHTLFRFKLLSCFFLTHYLIIIPTHTLLKNFLVPTYQMQYVSTFNTNTQMYIYKTHTNTHPNHFCSHKQTSPAFSLTTKNLVI